MANELHVIFGTGPLGKAVMRELVKKDKRVRMVNRSGKANVPAGVEVVTGNATDPASTREASKDAAIVYNCVNAPYTDWPHLFPPMQAGIIEGAAAAGAKLIVAENLYMYGPVRGKLTEDLPYKPTARKGRVRAQMAEALMEAHHNGTVRVAIGRASDFFGPEVLGSAVGARVFYPALAGKPIQLLGNLDVRHTYTFIDDFGKGLVMLGERDEALGQAWHIPSAETLITRQFVQMVFEEAGQPAKMSSAPGIVIRGMGLFMPMMRELVEMLYEFEEPFVVAHSKYEQCFGTDTTPHREAIRRTLDWYRQHPQAY